MAGQEIKPPIRELPPDKPQPTSRPPVTKRAAGLAPWMTDPKFDQSGVGNGIARLFNPMDWRRMYQMNQLDSQGWKDWYNKAPRQAFRADYGGHAGALDASNALLSAGGVGSSAAWFGAKPAQSILKKLGPAGLKALNMGRVGSGPLQAILSAILVGKDIPSLGLGLDSMERNPTYATRQGLGQNYFRNSQAYTQSNPAVRADLDRVFQNSVQESHPPSFRERTTPKTPGIGSHLGAASEALFSPLKMVGGLYSGVKDVLGSTKSIKNTNQKMQNITTRGVKPVPDWMRKLNS